MKKSISYFLLILIGGLMIISCQKQIDDLDIVNPPGITGDSIYLDKIAMLSNQSGSTLPQIL
jgi:hypothetical protein